MLPVEMKSDIQMILNPHRFSGVTPDFLSREATEPVRRFHDLAEAAFARRKAKPDWTATSSSLRSVSHKSREAAAMRLFST